MTDERADEERQQKVSIGANACNCIALCAAAALHCDLVAVQAAADARAEEERLEQERLEQERQQKVSIGANACNCIALCAAAALHYDLVAVQAAADARAEEERQKHVAFFVSQGMNQSEAEEYEAAWLAREEETGMKLIRCNKEQAELTHEVGNRVRARQAREQAEEEVRTSATACKIVLCCNCTGCHSDLLLQARAKLSGPAIATIAERVKRRKT